MAECEVCGRPEWTNRYDMAPADACSARRGLDAEEVACLRIGYERQKARAEAAEAAYLRIAPAAIRASQLEAALERLTTAVGAWHDILADGMVIEAAHQQARAALRGEEGT